MRASNNAMYASLQLTIAAFHAYVVAIRTMVTAFEDGIKIVVAHEQAFARLSQALHNADMKETTQQWYDYANARQRALGVDRDATVTLAAEVIELGYTAEQVRQLVPLLQELQASGIRRGSEFSNPIQVAQSIRQFVRGGGRSSRTLQALGIDVDEVRRSTDQIGDIIHQMQVHYHGELEIMQGSTSQAWESMTGAFKTAWQNTLDFLSPVIQAIIKSFENVAITWNLLIEKLNNNISFFPVPFTGVTIPAQTSTEGIAARVAAQGRTNEKINGIEQHTRETAQNTKRMADSMVAATLGAAGTIVKETAAIRNLNQAIKFGG